MSHINDLKVDISQEIEIRATVEGAYASLIRRLTSENTTPDNRPMPMVLEEWSGGRWFRDLGEGQGHLWGFVQVIKPPNLIEIHGPMFMSYAVAGHLRLHFSSVTEGVALSLRHQVFGAVTQEHRLGMQQGWGHLLEQIKRICES